ncbi:hypothetical protein ACH9D2_08180 [Kocuria sp. M4R2S49]
MFNARFVDGTITVDGPQGAVDGADTRETYEALGFSYDPEELDEIFGTA